MAGIIERVIKFTADVGQAKKEIVDLFNETVKSQKEVIDTQNEVNTTIRGTKTAAETANGGMKTLKGGVDAVSLSLKAMGIGLIVSAFLILKDLFTQNAKVARTFDIVMKGITLAFNDFIDLILDSTDYIKQFFENPMESLQKLGNGIKENIIVRVESAISMFGNLGQAIKKVFQGDWNGALESAKKAGKDFVDVQTGVKNSVDRLTKSVTEYTKKIAEEAEAYVDLTEAVALAEARNKGLLEQYDRLAEKQRQLRDDESESIATRKKANEDLGVILEKQQKLMLSNADLTIKKAKLDLAENATLENRVALINAQNERMAILAQIEGFRSEQLVNKIALEKEEQEMNQTIIDGINERIISERQFTDSLIINNEDRLNAEKATLDAEYNLEKQRLENKRALYKEGTQAYADAQEELLNLDSEYKQSLKENEIELQRVKVENNKQALENILNDEYSSFTAKKDALDEQRQLILEGDYESEEARTSALLANAQAREAIDRAEFEAKQQMQSAYASLADSASKILGEQTALGKAMAVASTTIDTYKGAQAAFVGMTSGNPTPVGYAMGIAAMAASVVTGLANVKKILAVKTPGGGSGGSVGGGGSAPAAPQFNVVGASSTNQLASTLTEQQNNPTRAYVLSSEVSSAQALDRNRQDNATFIG